MHDGRKHNRRPHLDRLRGKPDHPDPLPLKPYRPPCVVLDLLGMYRPVDFDAKLRGSTIEIENVGPDCVLAAEMQLLAVAA